MCMECAGVTLIHGCSTMEAFLGLVAMVRVGASEAMCSIRHEFDLGWKHTALRIGRLELKQAKNRNLPL